MKTKYMLLILALAALMSGCAYFTKIMNLDGKNPGTPYEKGSEVLFMSTTTNTPSSK